MRQMTTLKFRNPRFCNDPECIRLIRAGHALRMDDGTLVHLACRERLRAFGDYGGPFEEVVVRYLGKLPRNPELYRLEHLDSIKPLEEIAARLEPKDASAMYHTLSELYVQIVIRQDQTGLSAGILRLLANRFVPLSKCTIFDTVQECSRPSCGFPIWEGKALQTKDGRLYHLGCPETVRFETRKDVGKVREINARYSCDVPRDDYLESILARPEVQTLEAIFCKLGPELARKAYLAVENLVKSYGISGSDIEKLAAKYASARE